MSETALLRMSHYLPLLTTLISILFAVQIFSRYRVNRQKYHLLWWGLGVVTYGAGTLLESIYTLFGWHILTFKLWYIFGALLGGGPLAIGTIYLLMSRKAGHTAVALMMSTVVITSIFVFLSPIHYNLVDNQVLNSKVLEWQSIRKVSPFINGSAAIFLIGGAILSATRFRKQPQLRGRFIGNVLIAIGAILPGIGGGFSRAGFTEVLYITELVGLIMIYYGYKSCQKPVGSIDTSSFEQSGQSAIGTSG